MRIVLNSEDLHLLKLCEEILSEIPGQHFAVSNRGTTQTQADIYIWDWSPEKLSPKSTADGAARHLVLVNGADLASFCEQVGATDAVVLLKPVTRGALGAFLEAAAGVRCQPAAERDDVLKFAVQTNLKLQEYDQDRSQFLARSIQDFRAPLSALAGYCELLLSGSLGPLTQEQAEVLRRMQHSANRMRGMASAMLRFCAGEGLEARPEPETREIRECAEQTLHELAPLAAQKRITVSADMTPSQSSLRFVAGEIEQVILNLMDNACKFTPRNGRIQVSGYPYFWERRLDSPARPRFQERRRMSVPAPNAYRIDIRDSGPAIPEERLKRIFEEYTTYGAPQHRSGAGLGLAICKTIVYQHNGRIWASNTPSGPLFSFVLPLRESELIERQRYVA